MSGLYNYLSHGEILERAKENWNSKEEFKRIRAGNKYKHIFLKFKLPENDWRNEFSGLNRKQQNILLKGELIRSYDGLSNHAKTRLKKKLGLSLFSSKWFGLPPYDKKKLLASILNEEK